jgi:hypothetical protein
MNGGRRSGLAAAIVALVLLGIAFSAPYFPERFSDFRAFYCAGSAVRAHADPYREHPLDECERGVRAPGLSTLRSGVAVPAPFPGYALALFALFAGLPFPVASALWIMLTGGALAAAIVLLARVTATPLAAGAIALGFPAATVALPLGQVTPLVLLAIVAAAAALQAGRARLAAVAALGALLEPHVGLALVLGIAAGVPRARITLVVGCALLAVLGAAVSGPPHEWEYLRAVLPAHALANLADSSQFSTANLAYAVGFHAPAALGLGTLWYAAALGGGTWVALRLRARLGGVALALIPPAFVVFGGTHTHLAQLALAVPAFLLVCSAARGAFREAAVAVTIVAAIPWLFIAPFPLLFPAVAVLTAAFARIMDARRYALALAAGSFAASSAIFLAIVHSHVERGPIDAHVVGNPLAQVAWQIFVAARNTPPESWFAVAKAPTVIAFCALLSALVIAARNRVPVHAC